MKARLVMILMLAILPDTNAWSQAEEDGMVARTQLLLQQPVQEQLADGLMQWNTEMQSAKTAAAFGKLPLVMESLLHPWQGLSKVEKTTNALLSSISEMDGRLVESLMAQLLPLRDTGGAAAAEASDSASGFPLFADSGQQPLEFLQEVIEQAHALKEQALERLEAHEREFVASWPRDSVRLFEVHLYSADPAFLERYGLSGRERAVLRGAQRWAAENDLRFLKLLEEKIDWKQLGESAAILGRLADPLWQQALIGHFADAAALDKPVPGIEGDVLHVAETSAGSVIIGGPGENRYSFRHSPAAVIDLGGNNQWLGALAASREDKHSNSVLIALGDGRNEFHAGDFGLATGTLGVGLLLSGKGDDFFHGRDGCGGVGLGGIGLLIDGGGKNRYLGGRFSLGAAMGGIGAVVSVGSGEEFDARMHAIGFGGPGGVGVVLRNGGAASYRAGHQDASGYNDLTMRRGQSGFQTDAFSLGCGSGKRVFSAIAEEQAVSLAGGVGLLLEAAGNSTYDGSNFALGCGYYFGLGVLHDRDGDDRYQAARYGMAAGAHYGVGVFLDQSGDDRYDSTGPTYNCGAAWDRTAALFIDAGGNDQYNLTRSAGLGISQHSSWAVAADLHGADAYQVATGLGASAAASPAMFIDAQPPNRFKEFSNKASIILTDGMQAFRPPAGWLQSFGK
jgi:hypothetical protein